MSDIAYQTTISRSISGTVVTVEASLHGVIIATGVGLSTRTGAQGLQEAHKAAAAQCTYAVAAQEALVIELTRSLETV